jgi:hypothetical protein
MFPFDMMQDYPPSQWQIRIRIVENASHFLGEGFLQPNDDGEQTDDDQQGSAILISIPDDVFPVVPARTIEEAKRPWIELARQCGYDVLWVE